MNKKNLTKKNRNEPKTVGESKAYTLRERMQNAVRVKQLKQQLLRAFCQDVILSMI